MTGANIFWLAVVFVFGATFGSFLNVCIYRLPLGKSLLWPPSHCPKCFQSVGGWNIPIFGYFLLRGRCAHCGDKFSIQYPAIEFLNAALMAGLFYRIVICGGSTWPLFVAYAILTMILVVISFVDIATQIVPRQVSRFGIAAALVASLVYPSMHSLYLGFHPGGGEWVESIGRTVAKWAPVDSLLASLAGMIAGALICLGVRFLGTLAFRRRAVGALLAQACGERGKVSWVGRVGLGAAALFEAFLGLRQFPGDGEAMGLGDASIMAIIGGFLGWKAAPVVFLAAAFIGAICGIVSYLITREHKIPYGPYLSLGALVVILWGNNLMSWWFVDVMHLESAPRLLAYAAR